jgi:hypothetical protein
MRDFLLDVSLFASTFRMYLYSEYNVLPFVLALCIVAPRTCTWFSVHTSSCTGNSCVFEYVTQRGKTQFTTRMTPDVVDVDALSSLRQEISFISIGCQSYCSPQVVDCSRVSPVQIPLLPSNGSLHGEDRRR